MAFNNLGLQEPSTITARVATVTIARGSTTEHQEIMVLGDPASSNGVARVVDTRPASTEFGLGVRIISGPSSVADLAVRAVLSSTAVDNPVSAAQAGAWTVSVSGYSTTVNVSSVAGTVSVAQASTAWAVQLSQWSTTHNVSSLAGIVAVRPSDTNWASSAGFHFNSSGELQVVGTFSASTTVNVSSLAGRVAFAGFHAVAGIVNVTDSTNNAINVNVVAGSAAGSTIATISQLLDSSGGSITAGDSANQAIRVNVVAGAAGGSTIVTVSTGSVRVHQSTAADLQATVAQASTVWAVQLSNYSTTAQVSSVGGVVAVAQNSTVWAVQLTQWSTTHNVSSLAGTVSVQQAASTTFIVQARLFDGLSNALESSTSAPSSNARGLTVRPVIQPLTTYSASTTGQSSVTTVVSSNAGSRAKVFAYSITSTLGGPAEWGIYSGATRLWGGVLAATSSAISGVNLAVSPPGYLFASSTGAALTFNVASSNTGMNVSIAYWMST